MQLLVVLEYTLLVAAALAQTTAPPATTSASSTCLGVVAVNITKCPGLAGAFVPPTVTGVNTTEFDPDLFYEFLAKEMCTCGGQQIGKKWICSFILSIYTLNQPASCRQPSTVTQRISCRSACEATVGPSDTALCTFNNVTSLPVVSCSGAAWGDDQVGQCERNNFGGDKCTRPPFLNRKTANVPNWFWVILFPLLILIIVVAIVGFVLWRMKHDQLAETLNPCKWCECCPGYWDL